MQRDKEQVAATMREKQKKGNFHSLVATSAPLLAFPPAFVTNVAC